MRLCISTCLIAVCIAACSSPPPPAAKPLPHRESGGQALEETTTPGAPDIGDAEARIACALNVAADHPAEWQVRELKENRGGLAMVTVDIPAAVQPPLPVVCTLNSAADFADTPVVVTGRLLREVVPGQQEELGRFSAIAAAGATQWPKREGQEPAQWTFDALQGLADIPASLLLKVELTLMMTPPETDPAAIDANSVSVDDAHSAVEISNPLRINFAGAKVEGGSNAAS